MRGALREGQGLHRLPSWPLHVIKKKARVFLPACPRSPERKEEGRGGREQGPGRAPRGSRCAAHRPRKPI